MNERDRDPLSKLGTLASLTDDLRPTDDITDAVVSGLDPLDAALAGLARQTDDLSPSPEFSDAVMSSAVLPAPPKSWRDSGWSEGVVRWARFALVGAAAAAAASVLISVQAETRFDSTILDGVAVVEVDE